MTPQTPPFDRDRLPPGAGPRSDDDPSRLGPYEVVARIGAGGMGSVYAGIDGSGGCAAVKVVHEHFAADTEFRARFAREAGLVARVRATCTPAFLGSDVEAEAPWLATEYVPGLTLRQYVRAHGPLSGGTLTAFAAGLAEALVAIHAAGVVHRDLKPGNVILAPDGPKVLDFGIARAADGTALTATGGLLGTPGWVPPERYEGEDATAATDMFAWGGLVLQAATGRDPFGGDGAEAVTHRVRTQEADLTGLPSYLVPLVRAALGPDPRQRPTACQALAELTGGWQATQVGRAAADDPTEVVPELLATEWRGVGGAPPEPGRSGRRGRALLMGGGAVVLVAALLGTWFVVRPGEDAEPPEDPEPAGPAVARDPEDADAVIEEAVELAVGASDYQFRRVRELGTEIGHPNIDVVEYTEEPVRAQQRWGYDPAGASLGLRHGDDLEEEVAGLVRYLGDDLEEMQEDLDYYEGPFSTGDEPFDPDLRAVVLGIELVAEQDEQVTYQGESWAPVPDTESTGVGRHVEFEEAQGHHYSGTYTGEEGTEESFDLWIDEDGYPLHFASFEDGEVGGTYSEDLAHSTTTSFNFGEPVDIHIPSEEEISPDRPEI
ncbi:serine/threonine protein kinase [Nocardiopsis sp. HNM0947]|uniref:Serine/threonine protein kinase n=1 Tax=Nocardiopsis coralli TaxID=2772213 RepID=A0ABR9P642_9ACTN|nr:serine/threonine-protein kinase [Nocardiopsis coralli]MBE2999281.1 serine/threonine protein kinase [Nocardiopsis coralli]